MAINGHRNECDKNRQVRYPWKELFKCSSTVLTRPLWHIPSRFYSRKLNVVYFTMWIYYCGQRRLDEGLPDEQSQKQKLFWASLDQWNGIRLGTHQICDLPNLKVRPPTSDGSLVVFFNNGIQSVSQSQSHLLSCFSLLKYCTVCPFLAVT